MSFAQNYLTKFGRTLGQSEVQGFLKSPCTVNVHDYGLDADNKVRYELNGKPVVTGEGANIKSSTMKFWTVAELVLNLPVISQGRPDWCSVRWIDVDDGLNGEIIEFLIGTVQCAKQSTFNQIVDMRQSAMALLLDTSETTDAEIINFLLISRCPGLSAESVENFLTQNVEDGTYEGFVHSEQISFLLQISTDAKYASGGAPGTLITIQEGLSGDDFGEVRDKLAQGSDFVAKHGVAHLLLLLTRCTIESATDIEKFADAALVDLEERLMYHKELKLPHNYKLSKKVMAECDLMHRILLPMVDAFAYMCCGTEFPHEVLSHNVISWKSLHAQVRRLDQNIIDQKMRAQSLVIAVEDFHKEEAEQRSARVERSSAIMGLVLAMFSPLSFVTGMYGMNFVQPNGDPGLPELMWWVDENGRGISGYGYFWILVACFVTATLILYVYAGLIPNPINYLIAMLAEWKAYFLVTEKVVPQKKSGRRASTVISLSQQNRDQLRLPARTR